MEEAPVAEEELRQLGVLGPEVVLHRQQGELPDRQQGQLPDRQQGQLLPLLEHRETRELRVDSDSMATQMMTLSIDQ